MSTSINGKLLNATDLDPVSTSLDTVKSDILNAIANAGVPGEIKLVINPTGTAPAGTTKLENLAPEPTYSWLTAGEFRISQLPKAFVVADAPNVKYVQMVNVNEDFITTVGSAGSTSVKRFLASNGYVPTSLTLSGTGGVGSSTVCGFTDTGYLVYGSAASSMSGFYSVAPTGTSSTLKLIASFTGYGSRGYSNVANMGSTVIILNGGSSYNSPDTAGAWEFNPATNTVTVLPTPPFKSTFGFSGTNGGVNTCRVGNELYVLLTMYYAEGTSALVSTAPNNAIPLYKLSADRVWSKVGDMPSPYSKSADNTTSISTASYCRIFEAGGQLYIAGTVGTGSWPNTHMYGFVKIDPATGTTSFVELANQHTLPGPAACMIPSSNVSKALFHTVTTADGSKVYGATSYWGVVLQTANVVNAQPQTAFYVKKN